MKPQHHKSQIETQKCTLLPMRNRSLLLAIPVCLSILLTGCGDNKETESISTFPAPLNACDILKTSELEAILGGAVNKPEETNKDQGSSQHWMSMCIYYSDEKQIGMGVSILPHGRDVTGEQAFLQHENELKGALGDDYKQEIVQGVGDYAGWDSTTQQLTSFQGPYMLITGANSPKIEGAEALEINKKVSQKFLENLPR